MELDRSNLPIFSIIGKSNSGKTTLLEKLIAELKKRGYKVGVIKHHAHNKIEVDKRGKDTWRHTQAGADSVALVSPKKTFIVRKTENEMHLHTVAMMLGEVDVLLTEGYSWADTLKIEVVRDSNNDGKLTRSPAELGALVTDKSFDIDIPCFGLEEIEKLADFLEQRLSKKIWIRKTEPYLAELMVQRQ
jgi:molybdopterin-guanine dinucleotide biosynthesis protein B